MLVIRCLGVNIHYLIEIFNWYKFEIVKCIMLKPNIKNEKRTPKFYLKNNIAGQIV
jgi:hypothetical protein